MRMVKGVTASGQTPLSSKPLVLSTSIQNRIVGTSMLQATAGATSTSQRVVKPQVQIVRTIAPCKILPRRAPPIFRPLKPQRVVLMDKDGLASSSVVVDASTLHGQNQSQPIAVAQVINVLIT